MALLLALLLGAAPPDLVVHYEVAVGTPLPGAVLTVQSTWLGEEREVVLVDDGSAPGDRARDGIYTGSMAGEAVRMLPVRLLLEAEGVPRHEAWAATIPLTLGEDRITWTVERDEGLVVKRLPLARSHRGHDAAVLTWKVAAIGWALLLLVYVSWLVQRATGERR